MTDIINFEEKKVKKGRTHVVDGINKDLAGEWTEEKYMEFMKDWTDPYPLYIEKYEGITVVNDGRMDSGSKCRFGDKFVSQIEEEVLVYVQPRVGLAGVSLLELAKKYGKKVVLFMPSSKEISEHQAITIERGAIPKFRRIAAMPVLNSYAKKWAEKNGAKFIPLGLYHPHVVAGAARVARNIREQHGIPERIYCAISTGVLSRGLQIGFGKDTELVSVAVARNLKAGELGRAELIDEPVPFLKAEKKENLPPFESVKTYDAKVWKYALADKIRNPDKDIWFWNVGKDPILNDRSIIEKTDSQRDWHEVRDND